MAHVNHVAKGFDEDYNEMLKKGVQNRFDKMDVEKNYEDMFEMLEDDDLSDFLLWHMEMRTVTVAPYNIVQTDQFHERGYGSSILAK